MSSYTCENFQDDNPNIFEFCHMVSNSILDHCTQKTRKQEQEEEEEEKTTRPPKKSQKSSLGLREVVLTSYDEIESCRE